MPGNLKAANSYTGNANAFATLYIHIGTESEEIKIAMTNKKCRQHNFTIKKTAAATTNYCYASSMSIEEVYAVLSYCHGLKSSHNNNTKKHRTTNRKHKDNKAHDMLAVQDILSPHL